MSEEIEKIIDKKLKKYETNFIRKYKGTIIMLIFLMAMLSLYVAGTNMRGEETKIINTAKAQTDLNDSDKIKISENQRSEVLNKKLIMFDSPLITNKLKNGYNENAGNITASNNLENTEKNDIKSRKFIRISLPLRPDMLSVEGTNPGESIRGMSFMVLDNIELSELGININDYEINYKTEYWEKLDTFLIQHSLEYPVSSYNKSLLHRGYPQNSQNFLVKIDHTIDLKYKINPLRDTILGSYWIQTKAFEMLNPLEGLNYYEYVPIVEKSNHPELIGMTESQVTAKRNKDYWGYTSEIQAYRGWDKDSFSKVKPVCIALHYLYRDRYLPFFVDKSPLLLNNVGKYKDYSGLLPIVKYFPEGSLIDKIVFWFVPTEDFIEKLPERYRAAVRNEWNIVQGIEQGKISPQDACPAIRDSSFFDICRMGSGALTIEALDPNPTRDVAIVKFSLTEDRTISISVHDLSGNAIGTLLENQYIPKGKHEQSINLSTLNAGIYLVAIKTDKGEVAFKRVVIAK